MDGHCADLRHKRGDEHAEDDGIAHEHPRRELGVLMVDSKMQLETLCVKHDQTCFVLAK